MSSSIICQCVDPDPSTCAVCGAVMDEVRTGVYVCPVARTEARVIPEATRERGRALEQAIDPACGF